MAISKVGILSTVQELFSQKLLSIVYFKLNYVLRLLTEPVSCGTRNVQCTPHTVNQNTRNCSRNQGTTD